MKSTYLAELAKREGPVLLLFINYSQSIGEVAAVGPLSKLLGLALQTKQLKNFSPPKEDLLRLLFFVFHALDVARREGCRLIYHGLSKDDSPLIVPLVEPFMSHLQTTIAFAQPLYDGFGHWLGCVEVETPLRRIRREHIVRLGNEFHIPWELTYSCNHTGTIIHCGKCPGCIKRKNAFEQEGTTDPTTYRDARQL